MDIDKIGEGCLVVILTAIFVSLFTFVWAAIAQWLWGIVMVDVFSLPDLTYWQTFALIWLARMILPHGSTTSTKKN